MSSEPLPSYQERRLVEEVLSKDRKATAEFVAFCVDSVYSFVRKRLIPRVEMIDDLMQEILLAAWQGLPKFRGDASLRSWILGIARHKVDDFYRRRLRDSEITEESEPSAEPVLEPGLDRNLDAAAAQDRVERTLAQDSATEQPERQTQTLRNPRSRHRSTPATSSPSRLPGQG